MPQAQTLGMIMRNGTTVRIPFVTTSDHYNQRIVLVNRGSSEVRYEIEFVPEDGTVADPEELEDMLPAGTNMIRASDLVKLTGESARSAATIIVEAQPSLIDVATVTINKLDGSSDTVIYIAE